MSIGIAYNPCKNCKEMDKCSICELTYYRKGYIKSPTADVEEVRHGEWTKSNPYNRFMNCSVCGFGQDHTAFNYCPNCGAKMDGESEDTE